jgi:hypothetical protein
VIFAFSDDPGASSSPLGRIGGDQTILLNEFFDVGGIVHEILHSLGILHEQSRNDRDNFVDILENNIAPGRAGNFRKSTSGTVDIGPYDYGSIMHYSAWAFGRPAPGGGPMQTIQPFDPTIAPATLGSARNAAPFLTAGDIAGLRRLYPARTAFAGGHRWGSGNYATGVAFGDVDGDGRDELIITRRAGGNGRWFVVEDTQSEFVPMFSGGTDWGDSADGTCCACGDVDGDGRDEVLIGRRHGSNMRFALYDDANAGFSALVTGGDQWGSSAETTAVAIGIDAGVPLIAVARKHDTNARVFVYRYNPGSQTLDLLTTFGDNWGSGNYATGVAFGDVDGDGRLEIAVSRKAGGNSRWFIFNSRNEGFRLMKSGGASWGTGNYATGVAFGDVDGDGRDELVVTRRADENGRWFVFDDVQAQMRLLHTGGTGWGSSNYATACACGDVDGDGRAEIAIARKAGGNARFFVYDDDPNNYRTLVDGGYRWGGGNYATDVALGRSGAMAGPESSLAIARRATGNMRFLVQELSL